MIDDKFVSNAKKTFEKEQLVNRIEIKTTELVVMSKNSCLDNFKKIIFLKF